MTDGGELDEMLGAILEAMGARISTYQQDKYSFILDEMRVATRKVYEAGYNDCAEQFGLGVRIVAEGKAHD